MGGLPLRIDLLGCYGEGALAAVCGLIVLFGVVAGCRYSSSAERNRAPDFCFCPCRFALLDAIDSRMIPRQR